MWKDSEIGCWGKAHVPEKRSSFLDWSDPSLPLAELQSSKGGHTAGQAEARLAAACIYTKANLLHHLPRCEYSVQGLCGLLQTCPTQGAGSPTPYSSISAAPLGCAEHGARTQSPARTSLL